MNDDSPVQTNKPFGAVTTPESDPSAHVVKVDMAKVVSMPYEAMRASVYDALDQISAISDHHPLEGLASLLYLARDTYGELLKRRIARTLLAERDAALIDDASAFAPHADKVDVTRARQRNEESLIRLVEAAAKIGAATLKVEDAMSRKRGNHGRFNRTHVG